MIADRRETFPTESSPLIGSYNKSENQKEKIKTYFDEESNTDYKEIDPMTWAGEIITVLGQMICCPFCFPGSFITVEPKTNVIVKYWGRPYHLITKPGTYYYSAVGRTLQTVSIKNLTFVIPNKPVNDIHGSPLKVTGMVNYRVVDVVKASQDVENYYQYIIDQAGASLRDIASKYPYDNSEMNVPCLRIASEDLKEEMLNDLQKRVDVAGIRVINFQFTDIGYDEVMAKVLLAKQQAQANLDSRKITAEGVSEIAMGTIEALERRGLKLDEKTKSKATMDLLMVMSNHTGGNTNLFLGANDTNLGSFAQQE